MSARRLGAEPVGSATTLPPVRVDQVIPSLASRDAIGVHTLAIADALRGAGIMSDIFYGDCSPELVKRARPVGALGRPAKDRWLLYQSSIGSPIFDAFATRPEPKLVNYHNITPADLLQSWEPGVGYEVGSRPGAARTHGVPVPAWPSPTPAFNES